MFEKAIFRRSNQTPNVHINIGELANILLYYSEVVLLLDISNFGSLLRIIGPDALIRLAKLPYVKIIIVTEDAVTYTERNIFQAHKFVSMSLSDTRTKKPFKNKKDRLIDLTQRVLGENWNSRKQAEFLSQFVTESSFTKGLAGPEVERAAMADALDQEFLQKAVRIFIEANIPNVQLPENFRFAAIPYNDSLIVDTDLNLTSLGNEYAKFWPSSHSSLSEAIILSSILETRVSFGVAANLMGDIFTMEESSKIFQLKAGQTDRGSENFSSEISNFSDWVLSGKRVEDIINSGEKNFHDLLDLVENSLRFKKWISSIGQDQIMAKEYFNEIGATGWLEKLPGKFLRYSVFTGVSTAIGLVATPAVGIISGASIAAADTFLVDRLAKGWKPNHFVEGPFKKFLV